MSSVTVVCPNARRCVVKVTPGTLLRQVIEEACLKHGYDVNDYEARNQKKVIDLALPWRLSGLPNNATIEIVPCTKNTGGSVDIALQLADGSRQMLSVPVKTTLHVMLEMFGPKFDTDLVSPDDNGVPSCMYMNKHYRGEELQQFALSDIGITSGKCLIRYQRVRLSEEEQNEMARRLAEESERKVALNAQFEQKKRENEERQRIEAEREKLYEEDLRLREEAAERERQQRELQQNQEEPMDVEPPSILGDVTTFNRDRMPTPPPQNTNTWSFDAPAYSAPVPQVSPSQAQDRLRNLNMLLQQVDSSLSQGNHGSDHLVEMMAERGRVPMSQIATAATIMHQESTSAAAKPARVFSPPCDRRTAIYHKETTSATSTAEGEPMADEFFEVSVEDVKSMQKDLRQQVQQQAQRALLPKSFIDQKNRELKMAAYPNAVLRFNVGTTVVQANFHGGEPSTRIFEFFGSLLSSPVEFSLNFALNSPVERSDQKDLIDINLAPKSTLFVKFNKQVDFASILRDEGVTRCLQREADEISVQWLTPNGVFRPYTGATVEPERGGGVAKRVTDRQNRDDQDTVHRSPPNKATAPSWFKRGK